MEPYISAWNKQPTPQPFLFMMVKELLITYIVLMQWKVLFPLFDKYDIVKQIK